MTRASISFALTVLIASACVSAPGPSGPPIAATTPSAPPSVASTAAPSSSPASATSPTPEPIPTLQPFPDATPLDRFPPALEGVAWVGSQAETMPDGRYVQHVYAGTLNHPPTIRLDVEHPGGYPWLITAGDLVAIVTADRGSVGLEIRSAVDGTTVGKMSLAGAGSGPVAIDPGHRLAYVAMIAATGGVAIHRVSFDGAKDDVLVTLDKRFTPDGIPTERYDLTLDPDGTLIVEACGSADGCRLWEVPTGAKTAPAPRTLPGRPPLVCSIVGATAEWLIVQDDAACSADTSEARLPVRAVHRSDGRSHLVTDDHVGPGPLVEWQGRTVLVGADPVFIGATVAVVTYDLETGARSTEIRALPPGPDDTTTLVAKTVLPAPWILLQPWVLEPTNLPSVPASLFNIDTHQIIELPFGTFGWT